MRYDIPAGCEQTDSTPTTFATLRPFWIGGDKFGYLYDVLVDGEVIVSRSHDPEHDTCRALLAQGVKGKLTLTNLAGTPRSSIDIETGAEWTVIEDEKRGLLLVRYRKWPGTSAVPSVSEETVPGDTGLPAAANAAHKGDRCTGGRAGADRWETDDGYPHVVLRIENDWRVVGCRDDMQWIFQRRAGSAWRSLGYCRSKTGLRALLHRNSLDSSTVDAFPDMYPDGKRAASLQPSEVGLKSAAPARRETERA